MIKNFFHKLPRRPGGGVFLKGKVCFSSAPFSRSGLALIPTHGGAGYYARKNKNEQGISLFFTLIIMSVLLSISLGVSAIFWQQVQILKDTGNSVIAFYAADTGIERALREGTSTADTLSNSASYNALKIMKGEPDCLSAIEYCIKSVGVYKGTRRAIQITR